MKKLKNLEGAKVISKNEQKSIKGGIAPCGINDWCPIGFICFYGPIGPLCIRG